MPRIKILFPYMLLALVGVFVIASNSRRVSTPMPMVSSANTCAPCGMAVDPATALSVQVQGATHYYCSASCRDGAAQTFTARPSGAAKVSRIVDPVCQMEVNAGWGIRAEYQGRAYFFCTSQCTARFASDPAHYITKKCVVCGEALAEGETYPATYLDHTYELCSLAHRVSFKADPASFFMHTMWGIPTWMYYGSVAFVLILSFGVFDWMGRRTEPSQSDQARRPRHVQAQERVGHPAATGLRASLRSLWGGHEQQGVRAALSLPVLSWAPAVAPRAPIIRAANHHDRFDLLSIGPIRSAVRSRRFRFGCQAFVVVAFLVIIAAGLFGNQNPALNIAPILTWTIWWALLIVFIMFAGKAWCYVCPWDAIAGWVEKLAFWRKTDEGLSLGLRWPRIIRNISVATILFVGLTWIELGFGVTMKPRVTAYLAISMLLLAVISAMLFDRKSFCRYGCLVGRVSGLYALFAGVEVRAKSAAVCQSCHGKECVTGSDTAYGCPTFLYPGKLNANTYCIQCMECVQACPSDNLALNARPWGSDLVADTKPRADEAYLALLMLAITGFHGLTMTAAWEELVAAIRSGTNVGRTIGFSIGMALLMLGPIAVYAVLVAISKRLGQSHALKPFTYRDYFIRYAYAVLPIALFYHIAHNLEHLLMEGPRIVAMISDPFGWRWNLFGTADWSIPPLISLANLWVIQVLLVLIGHVYSLWVAQRTSLRLFGSPKAAFRSQVPMLIGMIAFSVFSLWLLKQPMEMRTSAM